MSNARLVKTGISTLAVMATGGALLVVSYQLLTYLPARNIPTSSLTTPTPSPTPNINPSCEGSTCTLKDEFWLKGVGIALSFTSNMHTKIAGIQGAVAPGSDVCMQTSSEGEVVGLGGRYFDSPPIEFKTDRSVVGYVGELIQLSAGKSENPNSESQEVLKELLQSEKPNLATARLTSTWNDVWSASANVQGTDTLGVQNSTLCSTMDNSFEARCHIDPTMQSGRVLVELKRTVKPLVLEGLLREGQYAIDAVPIESGSRRGSNFQRPDIVMSASATIDVDPNAPKITECKGQGEIPSPSPSPLSGDTPIPSPLTTQIFESPTFQSPQPPEEGESGGPPIFQQDTR